MRGNGLYAVAVLVALVACSGKTRPFGEGSPEMGAAGNASGEPSAQLAPSPGSASSGEAVPGGSQQGPEGASPVRGVQPVDTMDDGASDIDPSLGSAACPGCLVSGNCIAVGVVNSENPCEICAPDRDGAGWSSNDGAACDDGLFCTIEDRCGESACRGVERPCEDGVACNGVSICVEDDDACSAGENQCDNLQLCDLELDDCVSTCDGCIVDGVCIAAGVAASNNTCLVCDPVQSTTRLSVTEGVRCGSAATQCSAQDTCDAQGQCAPNHLPAGTICGPLSTQCDADDTCDGSGQCARRVAPNGSACDDGQFCTDPDRCQGGQCLGSSARNCGQNRSCDEALNTCVSDLSQPGEPCSNNADCETGPCTLWFVDSDGDNFGAGDPIGACGVVQPSVRLLPGQTLVLDGGDCCPSDPGSFPGFRPSALLPAQTQRDACNSFDRDCSGRVENTLQDVLDALGGPITSCQTVPPNICQTLAGTSNNFASWLGEVPACGQFGTQTACQFNGTGCTTVIGGQLDNRCR
jgi:hypothetical protein